MCHSLPATDKSSLSLEDTDLDNEPGESVKESQIHKRSGSFDYVAHLKSGLLSGIGQASASIASGSSGGSSGGGDSYKSHEIVVHVSVTICSGFLRLSLKSEINKLWKLFKF